MNSGGSNNVSLKYERYASSGCWDLGILKLGFVAKTQFLLTKIKSPGPGEMQAKRKGNFIMKCRL